MEWKRKGRKVEKGRRKWMRRNGRRKETGRTEMRNVYNKKRGKEGEEWGMEEGERRREGR